MKSNVEVLTTPTADTPGTSLLLDFADKKYLIGQAHEGCQRALVQRGKRLVKITDIFLTGRVEWKNIGGLIGLVITAADSKISAVKAIQEVADEKRMRKLETFENEVNLAKEGSVKHQRAVQRLKEEREKQKRHIKEEKAAAPDGQLKQPLGIHGGQNLMHAIAVGRRFIFRKGMPLNIREATHGADPATWEPTWADSNIKVWSIPVLPENCTESLKGYDDRAKALKPIIDHMFDSDWKFDALFETPLAQVRMPAAIFIRDPETHKLKSWTGPKPGEVPADQLPDVKVLVRKPWPAALVTELPSAQPSRTSVSYIIKNHPQRGRFQPTIAKELGVPVTKFKDLTQGDSVTLENGNIVSPEQVLEQGKEGGGFAVIDLPSNEYVRNLVQRPEWASKQLMEGIEGIFWLLGPNVTENPDLQSFIQKMGSIKHVISSKDHTPNYVVFHAAAASQIKLARIDADHHPILKFNEKAKELPQALHSCSTSHPGQVLHLEPKGSWDVSARVSFFNSAATINASSAKIKSILKSVRQDKGQDNLTSQNILGAEAEVITLGTGSAIPSKHRNVSGTLLRVPGKGSYLFDAGENTLGQIARMYDPDELKAILKDLKMIWISHMHADHHLGTISIIKAWLQVTGNLKDEGRADVLNTADIDFDQNPSEFINRDKLFIVSDKAMIDFLKEYSLMEDLNFDSIIGISVQPAEAGDPKSTKMLWNGHEVGFNSNQDAVVETMKDATGLVDLQVAPVKHCNGARAVAISFEDGFKVSYSGDCRPSKRFVEIGKGSTLLIHEATFDDELAGDARAKKHSTTSEAIRVGIEMGARRIMLTHFSQRYSQITSMESIESYQVKFDDADPEAENDTPISDPLEGEPELDDDSTQNSTGSSAITLKANDKAYNDLKVGMAHDHMRVKVKDIAVLEKFAPAINKLFEEEEAPTGDESLKKRKRK